MLSHNIYFVSCQFVYLFLNNKNVKYIFEKTWLTRRRYCQHTIGRKEHVHNVLFISRLPFLIKVLTQPTYCLRSKSTCERSSVVMVFLCRADSDHFAYWGGANDDQYGHKTIQT